MRKKWSGLLAVIFVLALSTATRAGTGEKGITQAQTPRQLDDEYTPGLSKDPGGFLGDLNPSPLPSYPPYPDFPGWTVGLPPFEWEDILQMLEGKKTPPRLLPYIVECPDYMICPKTLEGVDGELIFDIFKSGGKK